MARKLYYKIYDDGTNALTEPQWEDIMRLQHWYNSEFHWTAGRLAFKMYAVFPNTDSVITNEDDLMREIVEQRKMLHESGMSENEIIRRLEVEGLIIAKKGGYFDGCLASGFTRVAGNEFNAFIVADFLLKASRVAKDVRIMVHDEGEFIKSKDVVFRRGDVILQTDDRTKISYFKAMVEHKHVFAIVDAAKYDRFPKFQSTISDFNSLPHDEKDQIVKDWNWLGFENNYDVNGDDIQGFDLNAKVSSFELIAS